MSFRVAILVLLAACASPVAPPVTRAEVGALADEICACADAGCKKRGVDRLMTMKPRPEEATAVRIEGRRAVFCIEAVDEPAALALNGYLYAEDVCACREVACAIEAAMLRGRERPVGTTMSERGPIAVGAERDQHRRAAACFHALPGAPDAEASEKILVRLGEKLCACGSDASCKATVYADPGSLAPQLFADGQRLADFATRVEACGRATN